jgi:endonuclease YncB( thermonuclease family)
VLPWVFVLGMAAGTMLPARHWVNWLLPGTTGPASSQSQTGRDSEAIWRRANSNGGRHPVDVLYVIDGDTFGARVHLWPGLEITTKVRLRGIDAPELKAQCADELKRAEAAKAALRGLLAEGDVVISNIGADKYQGRIDADVATRKTPNVSAALLSGGFARAYDGGHRNGWCGAR